MIPNHKVPVATKEDFGPTKTLESSYQNYGCFAAVIEFSNMVRQMTIGNNVLVYDTSFRTSFNKNSQFCKCTVILNV